MLRHGTRSFELLAVCGEPASRDARVELRQIGGDRGPRARVEVVVWTYDFGPRRFQQIVTLERGVVVGVEQGGDGDRR